MSIEFTGVSQQPGRRLKPGRRILIAAGLLCASAIGQTQISSPASVARLNNRVYVDGSQYSLTQAGIQQAFTDACAIGNGTGTEVFLPQGGNVIVSNTAGSQFTITCPLRMHGPVMGSFWFIIANGVPSTVPVFLVRPSGPNLGYYEFDNFRVASGGAAGGDVFFLDSTNGGVNSIRIHDLSISGISAAAWFVNMNATTADQYFLGHIYDNDVAGGINMNAESTADSWLIEHNSFNSLNGGTNPCINATTKTGTAHITAFNNNGGCAGGFFISHGTTQCKVLYNQIEQPAISTEPNSAVIDLMGDLYNIDGCEIRGNNINQHNFADVGIRLGKATHTTIEGNVISTRPGGAGILLTPDSHDTLIPFNEYVGAGSGTAIRNPGRISAYAARGPEGKAQAPTFSFVNHPRTGWYSASGVLQAATDGIDSLSVLHEGIQVGSGQIIGWSSSTASPAGRADAALSSCGAACVAVGVGPAGNTAGRIRAGSAVFGSATIKGNLTVNGTIFKSAGGFRIDDPLDPENKYLSHSFVESPDMKNIYDGVAVLNDRGEAEVQLPDYFEALNKDFRYQLTCMGGSAPVYVAREIQNNRFLIAGGTPGLKVSWQVTGTRNDAYAQTHRIAVEETKIPRTERQAQ